MVLVTWKIIINGVGNLIIIINGVGNSVIINNGVCNLAIIINDFLIININQTELHKNMTKIKVLKQYYFLARFKFSIWQIFGENNLKMRTFP